MKYLSICSGIESAIVSPLSRKIIGRGWNGLPVGVKKTPERLARPEKYKWLEHAERSAIYDATAHGFSTMNAAMVMTWYPCADCARAIIQCGIREVLCREPDWGDKRWGDDFVMVKSMFVEAGIKVRFYAV